MHKIKCRCGQRVTQFRKKIGEFYIDQCCMIAGYNHLGEKTSERVNTDGTAFEAPKAGEVPVKPAKPTAEQLAAFKKSTTKRLDKKAKEQDQSQELAGPGEKEVPKEES